MATDLPTIYQMDRDEQLVVLSNSLYPGAKHESIALVLSYCHAAGLDPMQKPVHIVPMWDSKSKQMRDTLLPGIGLYRIQAARTGLYAGISEPEFGPMITETIGGMEITYPEYCKITVYRSVLNGPPAAFTAIEYWRENYAVRGGQEKSIAPNTMWAKRPRGQLNKCAEAQALRKAFPELGAQPTIDEIEGKEYGDLMPQNPGSTVDSSTGEIVDADTPPAQLDSIADQIHDCEAVEELEILRKTVIMKLPKSPRSVIMKIATERVAQIRAAEQKSEPVHEEPPQSDEDGLPL